MILKAGDNTHPLTHPTTPHTPFLLPPMCAQGTEPDEMILKAGDHTHQPTHHSSYPF